MASRYQELYRLPNKFYVDDSPVLIETGALQKDTVENKILAQVKMRNLSAKGIIGCKVAIRAFELNGKEIEGISEFAYLDMNISRGKDFGTKTPIYLPNNATRKFSVVVKEVVFADSSIWTSNLEEWLPIAESKRITEIFSNPEDVKQCQIEIGKDCEYYPEKRNGLFFCTCGAINLGTVHNCYKCGRTYDRLTCSLNEDELKCKRDERLKQEKLEKEEENNRIQLEKIKKEEKLKKIKKSLPFGVMILVLVLAALCVLIIQSYRSKCVPNVLESNLTEVKQVLDKRQIKYELEYDYTKDYAEGVVYAQSLEAGILYEPDTTVILSVSLGRIYDIPEVVNKSIDEVLDDIKDIPYKIEYKYTNDVEAGVVIETTPRAGQTVRDGEKLEIVVSSGIYTSIPDLTNKTEEDAKEILEELGVKVEVQREYTTSYDEGIVSDYSPKKIGDVSVEVVTINVSKGKGVNIRNLVGVLETSLDRKIKLNYETEYVYSHLVVNGIDPSKPTEGNEVVGQNIEGIVSKEDADKLVLMVATPAIQITNASLTLNHDGGVDTYFTIKNISDKQIESITLNVKYYDKDGNVAWCRVNNISSTNLDYTEVLDVGQTASNICWNSVIYDSTTAAIQPMSAQIKFTDGTSQNLRYEIGRAHV